jgi:hypothetical protein
MSVTQDRGLEATVDVDTDVELLTEQIRALKELGARGQVSEAQRYAFSIRWGTIQAGRLRRMAHYSSLGKLSDVDKGRFDALCDELRSVSGLIDRFRLVRPVFPQSTPTARHHREPQRTNWWQSYPHHAESPSWAR